MDFLSVLQFLFVIVVVLGLSLGSTKLVGMSKNKESTLAFLDVAQLISGLFVDMVVSNDDTKEIFRIVGTSMRYVESAFREEDNKVKEDLVVDIVLSSLKKLFPNKNVDDEIVKRLIRISVAFADSTYGGESSKIVEEVVGTK